MLRIFFIIISIFAIASVASADRPQVDTEELFKQMQQAVKEDPHLNKDFTIQQLQQLPLWGKVFRKFPKAGEFFSEIIRDQQLLTDMMQVPHGMAFKMYRWVALGVLAVLFIWSFFIGRKSNMFVRMGKKFLLSLFMLVSQIGIFAFYFPHITQRFTGIILKVFF